MKLTNENTDINLILKVDLVDVNNLVSSTVPQKSLRVAKLPYRQLTR